MGPIQRRVVKGVLTVVAWPRTTLLIAGVVLLGCIGLAVTNLRISTDQNKLFSDKVKFFRDYLDFAEKFPENNGLYVLIEPKDPAHPPPAERWMAVADRVGERARGLKGYVKSAEVRVAPREMGRQGVLFAEPADLPTYIDQYKQFVKLLKKVGEAPETGGIFTSPEDRLVRSRTPAGRFYAFIAADSPGETATIVLPVTRSVAEALRDPNRPADRLAPDFFTLDAKTPRDYGYSYLPDASDPSGQRHVLLVGVTYIERFDSMTAISDTVDAVRHAIDPVREEYPDFKIGVTGRPALEADEMRASNHDTHRAELAATLTIFAGLVIMFMPWRDAAELATWGGWLRALANAVYLAVVAEVALGVGIGWTFGWATLVIGQLNLLSLVFVIALIGIGMDYLIQILIRYRREVRRYERQSAVWARVFRYVSPPIATACMGAAGAFLVSVFTDFRGAAELGIIAGGGLLLCLLSGYTVLPAILTLRPVSLKMREPSERYEEQAAPPRAGGWKFATPVLWFGLLAVGVPFMFRVGFNPNLLDLQPKGLESVDLVGKLQSWDAVVLSKDKGTLSKVRDEVRKGKTVAATDSILKAYDNAAYLREHEKEIPRVKWAEKPNPVTEEEVAGLARGVEHLAGKYEEYARGHPEAEKVRETARALRELQGLLAARDVPEKRAAVAARLTQWQAAFLEELKLGSSQFMPADPDIEALPAPLRNHLRATDGTYVLYITPKEQLWNREALGRFVTEVEGRARTVPNAPDVTGISSNIYHSTSSIEKSFYLAAGYALGLIVMLVYLDLRGIRHTVLAISVLALGLPMLVAIMGLTHVSWNFANFFGLPILIGAGHEYGVFMVHRYREALHDPRRVWGNWDVSDRGLLLCAFVTCASFFYLWFGRHQGVSSLGLVMWVGVGCVYLATVLVLRPVLTWRLDRKRVRGERGVAAGVGGR